MRPEFVARHLEPALRESLEAPELKLLSLSGERPPDDERREPWIAIKYGPAGPDDWVGVVTATARFTRAAGAPLEELKLAVKVNPRQGLSHTLIPWIIKTQKIALDRPYWEYRRAAETIHTGPRESHVYSLAKTQPPLAAVLPRCYGMAKDPETDEHALFLEFVTNAARLDATGTVGNWPPTAIDEALKAAAGWQAAFWSPGPNQLSWAGPRPTTDDMVADAPLWRGILDFARRRFPDIVTDAVWRRRHRLIDNLNEWYPLKDRLPATLAHNDFNERNVGFRPQVLVLDWELAECNTPQRDLAELLTFVLPAGAGRDEIDAHVENHRNALIELGVSPGIDRDAWMEGFRAEIKAEAIDRVGLQFLFGAQFPLAYLATINRNIERLLDFYC